MDREVLKLEFMAVVLVVVVETWGGLRFHMGDSEASISEGRRGVRVHNGVGAGMDSIGVGYGRWLNFWTLPLMYRPAIGATRARKIIPMAHMLALRDRRLKGSLDSDTEMLTGHWPGVKTK